jgi:hypothetical protein
LEIKLDNKILSNIYKTLNDCLIDEGTKFNNLLLKKGDMINLFIKEPSITDINKNILLNNNDLLKGNNINIIKNNNINILI